MQLKKYFFMFNLNISIDILLTCSFHTQQAVISDRIITLLYIKMKKHFWFNTLLITDLLMLFDAKTDILCVFFLTQ